MVTLSHPLWPLTSRTEILSSINCVFVRWKIGSSRGWQVASLFNGTLNVCVERTTLETSFVCLLSYVAALHPEKWGFLSCTFRFERHIWQVFLISFLLLSFEWGQFKLWLEWFFSVDFSWMWQMLILFSITACFLPPAAPLSSLASCSILSPGQRRSHNPAGALRPESWSPARLEKVFAHRRVTRDQRTCWRFLMFPSLSFLLFSFLMGSCLSVFTDFSLFPLVFGPSCLSHSRILGARGITCNSHSSPLEGSSL